MLIGKVVGTVWATQKVEGLTGTRLVLVRVEGSGPGNDRILVAYDALGAGPNQRVLLVTGYEASQLSGRPVDACVVAILDRVELEPEPGIENP